MPILTQLPNLCCLHLEVHLSRKPLSPSRFTLSALRIYSAPIRQLELTGVTFSCIDDLMRYLSAFPNLSHLTYKAEYFETYGAPPSADIVFNYSLKLTYLVVSEPLELTCTIR